LEYVRVGTRNYPLGNITILLKFLWNKILATYEKSESRLDFSTSFYNFSYQIVGLPVVSYVYYIFKLLKLAVLRHTRLSSVYLSIYRTTLDCVSEPYSYITWLLGWGGSFTGRIRRFGWGCRLQLGPAR